MKNKLFVIVILVILVVFLFSVVFIKYRYENSKNEFKKLESFSEIKFVDLCQSEDNCGKVEDVYETFEYSYDDEKIQNWIKKINQDTESLYQEAINSNTNGEDCFEVRDIYKYKFSNKIYYYIYNNDEYISLAVERLKINLCTKENVQSSVETFIYSKFRGQQITQEEFINELGLDDIFIQTTIENNILEFDFMNDNTKDALSNYKLYFDYDGNLMVGYYYNLDNSYYSAVIDNYKNKNN